LFLSGFFHGPRKRGDGQDAAATRQVPRHEVNGGLARRRFSAEQAPRVPAGERGEGKLKTIIFLLFFASMIFVGFKTIPAYVAEYQLADKMQESARFAVVTRQNEDQIRDAIFKVVEDLDIPAKKEDIKVTSTNSLVTINVDYTVPVDLLVYQTEIHFSPSSANKSLF
jgi:hypothetical protein